MSIISFEP
ncbi:hypothetical protein YPPY54_0861, partial [Yersinia pestis PY-54]